MMHRGGAIGGLSCILVIIGGLNWGLVGLGNFLNSNLNVVNLLLGTWPTIESIVYILVGLAAIYELITCFGGKHN